jgi:pyruvate/2-oxoacid:ferredoxin oxidoreductase alpha subunit
MKKVLMGSHAVSYGVMRARAQVIAAYPITPQTHIVEELSEMCADGRLRARFIKVESEHSAMACLIGACTAGSRVFTATSSHGLALMHEVLHWAAGARLPIVMANVNRALGSPWNILVDQNDSLAQRDTGWIQYYTESNQEALDTVIQAYAVAERVLLPVMVNLDGFFLSHTAEAVDIPTAEAVDAFLPAFEPQYRLDFAAPRSFGPACIDDNYMHFRHGIESAMAEARVVASQVDEAFRRQFGRQYGIVESYRMEGARTVLVTSGTMTSTGRIVVDQLRQRGEHAGLLKIRLFRPFPVDAVRLALSGVDRVVVIDRNCSFGMGGGFASEVKAAMYNNPGGHPPIFGYIVGLGGQDVTPEQIHELVRHASAHARPLEEGIWMGVQS